MNVCRDGEYPLSASRITINYQCRLESILTFLEKQTGVEVGCISTGPERNQTIVKRGSRFAQLFG